MARIPPLNALKAFESAGRNLNFRLAAEEMGVTQGAVAQHVRALESVVNTKLFDRLPRGLAFTDIGRSYHMSIQRAFEMMQKATAEILPQQSVVTISVPPSFASMWLVPRLGQFSDANPDISVRVDASQRLANFQTDGIDIAVRQGMPPFGPGLVSDLLLPMRVFAVCSPDLRADNKPIETLADLEDQVLLHDTHGLWPLFLERAADGKSIPRTRSMNFSQTSLAVEAAIAGQGIALANDLFVEESINAGRLRCLFEQSFAEEQSFYVVMPRRPRNAELVHRMQAWLLENSPLHAMA